MLTMLFTGCGGDTADKPAEGDKTSEVKKIVVGLDDKAIAHLISVDWIPAQMRIVSGVLMERGEEGVAQALAELADAKE